MSNERWRKILVNWTNCYNERTDWHLQSILEQLQFSSLDNSQSHEPQTLDSFIKEKYPAFKFENGTSQPTTDEDMCIGASLLLLSVCVQEKHAGMRDVMCSGLSREDQEVILKFTKCLMNRTPVTYEDVHTAIIECCGEALPSLSAGAADTPPPLRALYGEVRRLRAALDSERFDRSYLQDELSATNSRLDKLLQEKEQCQRELSSLRALVSATREAAAEEREGAAEGAEGEARALARQLAALEERLVDAQAQHEDCERTCLHYKKKLDDMKLERERLAEWGRAESERACSLSARLEDERTAADTLREALAELQAHRRRNEREDSLVECDDADAPRECSFAHDSSACGDACAGVVEVQLFEERARVVRLMQQLQAYEDKVKELQTVLLSKEDEIQDKVKFTNELCETFENKNSEMQCKLNENHKKSEEVIISKNFQIKQLEHKNMLLKNKLEENLKQIELNLKEIECLEKASCDLKNDVQSKQLYIEELLSIKESLENESDQSKNTVALTEAKLSCLEIESFRLKEEKSEALKLYEALNKYNKILTCEHEKSIKSVNDELVSALNANTEMKQALHAQGAEISKHLQINETLEKTLVETRNEFSHKEMIIKRIVKLMKACKQNITNVIEMSNLSIPDTELAGNFEWNKSDGGGQSTEKVILPDTSGLINDNNRVSRSLCDEEKIKNISLDELALLSLEGDVQKLSAIATMFLHKLNNMNVAMKDELQKNNVINSELLANKNLVQSLKEVVADVKLKYDDLNVKYNNINHQVKTLTDLLESREVLLDVAETKVREMELINANNEVELKRIIKDFNNNLVEVTSERDSLLEKNSATVESANTFLVELNNLVEMMNNFDSFCMNDALQQIANLGTEFFNFVLKSESHAKPTLQIKLRTLCLAITDLKERYKVSNEKCESMELTYNTNHQVKTLTDLLKSREALLEVAETRARKIELINENNEVEFKRIIKELNNNLVEVTSERDSLLGKENATIESAKKFLVELNNLVEMMNNFDSVCVNDALQQISNLEMELLNLVLKSESHVKPTLEIKFRNLCSAITDLKERNKVLNEKFESMELEKDFKIKMLDSEVEALSKSIAHREDLVHDVKVSKDKDMADLQTQVNILSSELIGTSEERNVTINNLEKIVDDKNRTITALQDDIKYVKSLVAESEYKLLDVCKELEQCRENCQELSAQLKRCVGQKNEEINNLKKNLFGLSNTESSACEIIKVSEKYQAIILKSIADIESSTVFRELTQFSNIDDERKSLASSAVTMGELEIFLENTERQMQKLTEKQSYLQIERNHYAEICKTHEDKLNNMNVAMKDELQKNNVLSSELLANKNLVQSLKKVVADVKLKNDDLNHEVKTLTDLLKSREALLDVAETKAREIEVIKANKEIEFKKVLNDFNNNLVVVTSERDSLLEKNSATIESAKTFLVKLNNVVEMMNNFDSFCLKDTFQQIADLEMELLNLVLKSESHVKPTLQIKLRNLCSAITDLKEINKVLNEKCESMELTRNINHQVKTLEDKLNNMNVAMKDELQKNNALSSELLANKNLAQSLKKVVTDIELKYDDLNVKYNNINHQIKTLTDHLKSREELLEVAETKARELEVINANNEIEFKKVLKDFNNNLVEVTSERDSLLEKNNATVESAKKFLVELNNLVEIIDNFDSSCVNDALQQIADLETELLHLVLKSESHGKPTLQIKFRNLCSAITDLKERNKVLNEKCKSMELDKDFKIKMLADEVAALSKSIAHREDLVNDVKVTKEKDMADLQMQVNILSSDLIGTSEERNVTINNLEKIVNDKNYTITALQNDIKYLKSLVAESEYKLLDVSKELEQCRENCQELSAQLKRCVGQKNEEINNLKKTLFKLSNTESSACQIIKVSAKYQAIILKRIAEIKSSAVLRELTQFSNVDDKRKSLASGAVTMDELEIFLENTERQMRKLTEKQSYLQKERDHYAEISKINEDKAFSLKKYLTELIAHFKTFSSVKEAYNKKLSKVISQQRIIRREIHSLDQNIPESVMTKLERSYGVVMQDLVETALNIGRWAERCIDRSICPEKLKQAFASNIPSLSTSQLQNTGLEVQIEELLMAFKKVQDQVQKAKSLSGVHGGGEACSVMEVRAEYEDKLNRMKAKMKQLYQEQMSAYQARQEAELSRLQRKLEEKTKGYEEHIADLTKELWSVGEKFLMKKEEADWLRRRPSSSSLMSLQHVHSSGLGPPPAREARESSRATDTQSLHRVPAHKPAKSEGRGFHMSDEEGEVFDNRWLKELETPPRASDVRGRATVGAAGGAGAGAGRISELKYRNSLCPPHLKSSYPAETHFASLPCNEDEIKFEGGGGGGAPAERRNRKEVGITAYKKPGPPTPSKNAGRLSATDSELRESLRPEPEGAAPAPQRKTGTPSRIRALFRSNRSDAENTGTPRSKRLSIFRKKQ